eukprot:12707217-Ditylum_brightwellii.AAC.1
MAAKLVRCRYSPLMLTFLIVACTIRRPFSGNGRNVSWCAALLLGFDHALFTVEPTCAQLSLASLSGLFFVLGLGGSCKNLSEDALSRCLDENK